MEKYEPSHPDPLDWLALDESERIDLVRKLHGEAGEILPENSENMHAVMHVIVENQIARQ